MQGIQNSFSNYMQQNPSGTAQASKQQGTASQETVKTAGSDTDVKQQYEQYQNQPAADKVNSTPQDGSEETGALNETVEEAVEAVKDLIKENLGIDDEQLQAAMELLGLTQADLLNPQQLIALSVELTGSQDAGMMLFHENFQNLMQETTVVTQDLLKELGMTMEELQKMRDADIMEADRAQLADISDLKIDREEPVENRIRSYLEQTGNPFLVKSGEYILKFSYGEKEKDMNDRMAEYVERIARIHWGS